MIPYVFYQDDEITFKVRIYNFNNYSLNITLGLSAGPWLLVFGPNEKVLRMEEAGTPRRIVEDEKISMINRFSSSIRLKFLMFLVVVGATTVMSMEFLQSFQLAIIVLMPVLFLVVIPFIASKIIQVLGRVTGAITRKSSVSTE